MGEKKSAKKNARIDELTQLVVVLSQENERFKKEYGELSDDYLALRFKSDGLYRDFPVGEMVAIMAAAKRKYGIGQEAEMLHALCDTVESWLREHNLLAKMRGLG